MTPEQFCYWLQGYFELSITSGVTPQQAQVIKDHLQLVLKKETPKRLMVAKESSISDIAGHGDFGKLTPDMRYKVTNIESPEAPPSIEATVKKLIQIELVNQQRTGGMLNKLTC